MHCSCISYDYISYACCFLQSRIEELRGEILALQGQLKNATSTKYVLRTRRPRSHGEGCGVGGVSKNIKGDDKDRGGRGPPKDKCTLIKYHNDVT